MNVKLSEGTRKICFEKRMAPTPKVVFGVNVVAVVGALVFGGIFLAFSGYDPLKIYALMIEGSLGSPYSISETVVKAIPLLLCGLGVGLAFRMKLWNIGAEGQLYMGGFAASFVALSFPHWPASLLLPAMAVAGFAGGALWAFLPAVPRAFLGTNETITTLMFNYVAILWVEYLVHGPWKDPASLNFPLSPQFVKAAWLPTIAGGRIHLGLLFGLVAAFFLYLIFRHTKWGYEIQVIGESPAAARYAGINVRRNILLVMLLSGGLAGLAGMSEIAGITHRLQAGFSPGYGYSAIIIAWLSKLNPWATVPVAFLFGALLVGGYSIQTAGLPAATAAMLQGTILFFVLGCDILTRYRLTLRAERRED